MVDAEPKSGAMTVDESLVPSPVAGAPVVSVAEALSERRFATRFAPVRVVAKHVALLPAQELRNLSDATDIRRRGAQTEDDAVTLGARMPLYPEVPALGLIRLLHLGVARKRRDQRQKPRPRDHRVHLFEELFALCDLEPLCPNNQGKGRLPHGSISSTAAAYCTQYRSFGETCAEVT